MFLSRLVFLLVLAVSSLHAAPKVHEFKLDNGLILLIQEDHRAPVAVSQIWYKVGSSYEHDGLTGISHMLEHMMFKGTRKHAPGEFSRIIAANGGSENAFTGEDYTAYFQTLEKGRLAVSFELEADRMQNLILPREEFEKEHQVVLEERRLRVDDQPHAKMDEHFSAMAYSNGPYKNPVIGWPSDVAGLTVDDLKDWYGRWYAPNNATLVIVGDVDPQEILALTKKYFASLKPGKAPPVKSRQEVEQLGPRRMIVRLPAKLPALTMGYKVPVLNSVGNVDNEWEAYALEVAAGVLDGGNSARLPSRLVRGAQIAASAGAGYELYARLPSLFILQATPVQGKTLQVLEESLTAEIKRLQDEPVTPEELERVKAQVLASEVYQRDSMFYQAMRIGVLETIGVGWKKINQYVDRISAVTPEQVQQVARKYFVDGRLSVAYLEPLPMSTEQKDSAPPLGDHHVR
jgi:zinc protease